MANPTDDLSWMNKSANKDFGKMNIPNNAPGIEGNAFSKNNDDVNTIDDNGPDDS